MFRGDEISMLVVLLLSVHVQTGACDSCEPGYYKRYHNGHYSCHQCPINCVACSSRYSCSSCEAGYYGYNCDNACPNNCATCTWSTHSTCSTCKRGYYGYACTSQCSQACGNGRCDRSNGACTCMDGYIGYFQNNKPYGYECVHCPDQCISCRSSSECTSCSAGYFGETCDKTCNNCRNDSCWLENGVCINGCKGGYYQDTTGCKLCPGHCSVCTSNTECDECRPGYYGSTCQQLCPRYCMTCENGTNCLHCEIGFYGQSCETECSALCKNGCNKDNGECDGCIEAHYKEDGQCKECSDGCASCQKIDACKTCKDGYFLDQNTHDCDVCGPNCSTCTGKDSCTECKQGYANVNGSCLSCQNCNNYTACISKKVCYQCIDGFWGSYCENKCNDTCIRCGKPTGKCTECTDNTFGPYCELQCSRNCVRLPDSNSTCLQHNGTCTDGCIRGFTGHDCTDELSPAASVQVVVIAGTTSGVVAFIVVVVIVVISLWRRSVSQQDSKAKEQEPNGSQCLRAVNEVLNPTYDDTNNDRTSVSRHQNNNSAETMGSADQAYVYAVVQEESLRKPAKPNKANGHEIDYIYDVSTGGHGQGLQADNKMSQAEGDTYSHISHASRARQLRHNDEDAYDHVTRHNLQKRDDNDTYDVTSGSHDNYYHVHGTSKQSADEYSTIGLVQ